MVVTFCGGSGHRHVIGIHGASCVPQPACSARSPALPTPAGAVFPEDEQQIYGTFFSTCVSGNDRLVL